MPSAVPAALACLLLAGALAPAVTMAAPGGAAAEAAPSDAAAPGAAAGGASPAAADAGGTPVAAAVKKPTRKPAARKRTPLSAHLGQRTLRRGARGHDVRVLQDLLTKAGYPTPIAGTFGPLTQRQVRAFERAQGLVVDGVVSRADAARLRRAAANVGSAAVDPNATLPPPGVATLLADGTAAAPSDAPPEIRAAIDAANRIASTPYLWGGGHAHWEDRGYDCSGSVSYALHGGGLLDFSQDSGGLMSYGEPGPGRWITLYANADHVYATIAGLRYDTSGAKPSRWQTAMRVADGFAVRHPAGF